MLRDEKGFTLLETLAAMTILAVAILTLIQMFSGSINQAAQAERYLNGVYLAQQKFSQLEMANFKSDITEGEFENQEGYRWQLEILPYESPLNNEEARIQIEKVSLRVYWEDRDQEKEVQLVSLKTLGETHVAPANQLGGSSQTTATTPEAPKIKNLDPSGSP
jgi:general secretion pathway protein I